ncbi:hypothetical protein J5N97_029829 [Dioscorea zingiberensis]|uniref:Remorin C-terminal domain-containing protein n=1 Tax=Dioscorea zingiberensis TaxID=325984 RepID=A0A9D5BWF8_9LILI|nr:hypothetical protein J5N97_029829 [Dioscorea zingiberensis]
MATTRGGNALPCRCDSSFGSCAAFSFASLDDKCPSTPSPVCSPIASSSSDHLIDRSLYPFQQHHTPPHLQGFSSMANNGCKNLVQGEKLLVKGGRGEASPQVLLFSPSPIQKMRGGEKQNQMPNSNLSGRSSLTGCSYLHYMNENENNNCTEDGGRLRTLSVLVEEKEDRGCNSTVDHPVTQSSHFSAATQGGSSRSSASEEYDGSSEEIEIQGARVVRPMMNGFVPDIRTELEAKLTAWKEARLRKEEEEIEEWERKEMAKAKMEMKELETRLEKQREGAMMRMQRRIRNTKKEAEQRLHRERSSTAQKISSVSKSFDKINNTGKLSWKLICF